MQIAGDESIQIRNVNGDAWILQWPFLEEEKKRLGLSKIERACQDALSWFGQYGFGLFQYAYPLSQLNNTDFEAIELQSDGSFHSYFVYRFSLTMFPYTQGCIWRIKIISVEDAVLDCLSHSCICPYEPLEQMTYLQEGFQELGELGKRVSSSLEDLFKSFNKD